MPTPRLVLAAVLSAIFVMAPGTAVRVSAQTAGPPPDPGVGVRLLEAPEDRRDDPRARRYIIDHVAPGATISRRFEVSNGTDRRVTMPLYAEAAAIRDEAFVPSGNRQANDLTSWSTVAPDQVTLDPGGRAKATVTIAVPADATAGEYYGVIVAELPPPPPDPSQSVTVVSRAGIRIYLSVGKGTEPESSFRLDTFAPALSADGTPSVVIDTCNTGGRALDIVGELGLDDGPGGTSAGPFESDRTTTLAPADCGKVTVPLKSGLPRGPWKATATLRSGKKTEQATATITFPTAAGTKGAAVKAELRDVTGTSTGRWALVIALLLLLLVLLGLLLWWWRRRRRSEDGPQASGESSATVGKSARMRSDEEVGERDGGASSVVSIAREGFAGKKRGSRREE